MDFKLYKVTGYEEAIMSLRMSKGKYYSWEKAREIRQLVYVVTDDQGFLADGETYRHRLHSLKDLSKNTKVTGSLVTDVHEFKRLLQLTFKNAMGEFKHHTLMKYIDVSFFTVGLHRGAQDDLDAHAIAFNNRITRFSTRLAEIDEVKLSEWYRDKIIPFHDAHSFLGMDVGEVFPEKLEIGDLGTFCYTPFGYVLERYAQVPAKNGLAKDVQRGGMLLGMESNGLWKIDLFNLRYVYKMRNKLTTANPELKIGIEKLADQIEQHVPVFGPYFRKEFTDSGQWEHVSKVKTITAAEFEEYKKLKLLN